jgi:hypothetical protein
MGEGIYNELVFRNRKQRTWKKNKFVGLLVAVVVAILLVTGSYASLNIGANAKSVTLDDPCFNDTALKPDWVVDDSWTYHVSTFDFEVEVDVLTVHISDGEIDDLDVVVDEVQSENYKITFESSDVSGWVEGLLLWWGNLYQTTFSGEVYLRKSDLAIMDLTAHMEGYIKKPIGTKRWFELDIEMDITDGYDPYHFPIVSGESWVVDSAPISVYTSFYLYGLYDADETTYSSIDEHTSTCTEVVDVSVEAGTFESFHIESELGTVSESYYAPAAFNTVKKLGEGIQDNNQIFTFDIDAELKSLSLQNHPPYPPETPSGPTSGYRYTSYTYSTSAIDPDGDQVRYKFDWGDGNQSDWTGWVDSGQSASKSYSWDNLGSYCVKAKSQDENYEESDWSSCLWTTIQNRAPIANDDTPTVDEDSSDNEIDVLANDEDPDGDDLEITGVSAPSHGNVTNTSEYVYYTPDPDYCGSDSFMYNISDGYGGEDIAYVNITVTCINDPPVANDDFYEVDEDDMFVVPNGEGVLVNDSDIDGPAPLSGYLETNVAHGTLWIISTPWLGYFIYIPDPDYCGTDNFTYKAYDGEDFSNIANVTITINPISDPPVANNDSAAVLKNSSNNQIDVLANDYDPDGDDLEIISVTQPSHGSVTYTVDYAYYTPDPDYIGNDTFTYTITDNNGSAGVTATVNITVVLNNPPNAPSDPNPENSSTNVSVDANLSWNCSDPDGDSLTYDVYFNTNTTPTQVAWNQTDASYNPPETMNFNTTYYWQIVAWDNHNASTTGPIWHFTTISEPNDPPYKPTINGPTSGTAGEEYDYTFSAQDPEDHNVSYKIEWGDGDETGWLAYVESETEVTLDHIWDEKDDYTISCKAKDTYGEESDWATLEVTMPKNKPFNFNFNLLSWLFERFPNAFPILRQILGL